MLSTDWSLRARWWTRRIPTCWTFQGTEEMHNANWKFGELQKWDKGSWKEVCYFAVGGWDGVVCECCSQTKSGLELLGCCLGWVDGFWLGYSFTCQYLTAVLICFPVLNPCKQVCSHLCLLRPGGYSCACPQGSNFLEGSTTECDAGRHTSLEVLGTFKGLKNSWVTGSCSMAWQWLKRRDKK